MSRFSRIAAESLKCRAEIAEGEFVDCDSPIQKIVVELIAPTVKTRRLIIETEYSVDRYRYDIAVMRKRGKKKRPVLLIECDGMQYHWSRERTLNDWRKTELAESLKVRLLRFWGSDIINRPSLVYDDVFLALEAAR